MALLGAAPKLMQLVSSWLVAKISFMTMECSNAS
jgi:hypothetical protein